MNSIEKVPEYSSDVATDLKEERRSKKVDVALLLSVWLLAGLVHGFVWREQNRFFMSISVVTCVLFVCIGLFGLYRERALRESIRYVPGDIARGFAGAALGIVLVYGTAMLWMRKPPQFFIREVWSLYQFAAFVSPFSRILLYVSTACATEIVVRIWAPKVLAASMSPLRALWVCAPIFVIPAFFSKYMSIGLVAAAIAISCTLLWQRTSRFVPLVIAHTATLWVTVEKILPAFWEQFIRRQ